MKTTFCPGPGMGLYEFCRMSFGVQFIPMTTDKVLHGLPFDNLLVQSASMTCHASTEGV